MTAPLPTVWPLTGDAVCPADTPDGHVRNALATLRIHRQVAALIGPALAPGQLELWLDLERRLGLALLGLARVPLGDPIRTPTTAPSRDPLAAAAFRARP